MGAVLPHGEPFALPSANSGGHAAKHARELETLLTLEKSCCDAPYVLEYRMSCCSSSSVVSNAELKVKKVMGIFVAFFTTSNLSHIRDDPQSQRE